MPPPAAPVETSPAPAQASRPVSVVTGASAGIGLAIARLLARRGRHLLLVARSPGPLEATAGELRATAAGEVCTLALDLAQPDACAVLDDALARHGFHVDLLVNAAGMGASGAFAEADPAALDALVALNVAVPTRLMRHVLPGMRQRRRGAILNIASLGGYTPGPYQAAYYASKAYLISLSEAVAAEVRSDGVRITVVAPGPVETSFHAKMGADNAFYRRFLPSSSPESVARWAIQGSALGLRVVVPGIFNLFCAGALKLLPHAIIVPLMAWLLTPRRPT